jgi:hypothetical protein
MPAAIFKLEEPTVFEKVVQFPAMFQPYGAGKEQISRVCSTA